jgi:tRNA(fMet)-specific endonuclease VapC
MTKYLLDTNICIYYIKGLYNLDQKLAQAGENFFISEITLAELKFGIANSVNKDKNNKALNKFLSGVRIVPIISCLDVYAKEKARLRKLGTIIDEFDLLIGSTAIANNFTLVTKNLKHFERLENLMAVDWTKD